MSGSCAPRRTGAASDCELGFLCSLQQLRRRPMRPLGGLVRAREWPWRLAAHGADEFTGADPGKGLAFPLLPTHSASVPVQ